MTTHYHSGDEGVSKMAIHTSRFSNPELRSGKYTTVRISLGTGEPRSGLWAITWTLSWQT